MNPELNLPAQQFCHLCKLQGATTVGNLEAGAELSRIALGGNKTARTIIDQTEQTIEVKNFNYPRSDSGGGLSEHTRKLSRALIPLT